jgi:antitoxin HicB
MAKAEEYLVLIAPLSAEDGGGYIALVPDLVGCMSDGSTREEALANAQQAILEWMDAASEAGKKIPEPNSAQVRAIKQKRDLEAKVMEQAKAIAALDAELKALRIDVETFGSSWPVVSFSRAALKEQTDEIVH